MGWIIDSDGGPLRLAATRTDWREKNENDLTHRKHPWNHGAMAPRRDCDSHGWRDFVGRRRLDLRRANGLWWRRLGSANGNLQWRRVCLRSRECLHLHGRNGLRSELRFGELFTFVSNGLQVQRERHRTR